MGQAQRGRAGTQRLHVLRDFINLPKPWQGRGGGNEKITVTNSDQELGRKELTRKGDSPSFAASALIPKPQFLTLRAKKCFFLNTAPRYVQPQSLHRTLNSFSFAKVPLMKIEHGQLPFPHSQDSFKSSLGFSILI